MMTGGTVSRPRPGSVRLVAWSATSPYGTGRQAYADGERGLRSATTKVDRERWDVTAGFAGLVPDFDTRAVLGKKGTRMMNRVTGLSVSTVGLLIDELGGRVGPETGLVLGTTHGSAQSSMDFTRGSLTGAEPFHVESGLIPYAVMNGAAGQCAIWHGLKGPNATIAASRPSHLLAMNYARRLLLAGRASTILCGAAEEFSAARYWLAHAAHAAVGPPGDLVLGEGCAMFALTTERSGPALATLLSVSSMNAPRDRAAEVIGRCIDAAFARAGVTDGEVWGVCSSGGSGVMGATELDVVSARFGTQLVAAPAHRLGEADSTTAAFQLATVLTLAGDDADTRGRVGLLTCVDDNGVVCAAVFRLGE
jgi:3-oxoacyl-[acyl-carrier-protein] synthase II